MQSEGSNECPLDGGAAFGESGTASLFHPCPETEVEPDQFGAERSYHIGLYLTYLTEPVRDRLETLSRSIQSNSGLEARKW